MKKHYCAVVGRVPYAEEDTVWASTRKLTLPEAEKEFTKFMLPEETYDADCPEKMEDDTGTALYVNCFLFSDSPITIKALP